MPALLPDRDPAGSVFVLTCSWRMTGVCRVERAYNWAKIEGSYSADGNRGSFKTRSNYTRCLSSKKLVLHVKAPERRPLGFVSTWNAGRWSSGKSKRPGAIQPWRLKLGWLKFKRRGSPSRSINNTYITPWPSIPSLTNTLLSSSSLEHGNRRLIPALLP